MRTCSFLLSNSDLPGNMLALKNGGIRERSSPLCESMMVRRTFICCPCSDDMMSYLTCMVGPQGGGGLGRGQHHAFISKQNDQHNAPLQET